MKVLVTGGAGFIGSHLADRLLERGDEVCVIDNYATGRRDNLAPHPRLNVIEGTIAETTLVRRIFDEFRPEQVVHAAASYKDPENWTEDALTNVVGTTNIVNGAQRHGVKRLINFQTSLCYGLKPIEQPITLSHPIRPEGSSYAISKTAGEQYVMLSGLNYISFRLANAYGPRNVSGPLPTFFQRLTTQKPCFVVDTRRDFIYIDDLVEVVMLALAGQGLPGAYHVASGRDYAIKELYDATVRAMGVTPVQDVEIRPRNPDDVYTIFLDPSHTNAEFGWKTKTVLENGVRPTVEWYQKHGLAETFTHLKPVGAKG
jgi:UDP-glucose 4-epimerase